MKFPETSRYLESFVNYEKKRNNPYKSLKLERVRGFLQMLGDPQDGLRCIHVAGTKGKGSTSVFCANILRCAGFSVGLYTSPHLSDTRERMRILRPSALGRGRAVRDFDGMIPKKELARIVTGLRPKIERYNQDARFGPLTFFEVYTAIAFIYFSLKKVDFVILETGLGGRLDATNVCDAIIAAITPISFEHTHILGKTLKKIASEKAGIIKKGQIVISAQQGRDAGAVIRKKCRSIGAKLYEVGKDIAVKPGKDKFCVRTAAADYSGLKIKLLGRHQLLNAATSVGVIDALSRYGINIGISEVRKGLLNTRWPGRCEPLATKPAVILDGAQNGASALAIKRSVNENFSYEKLILVLGVCRDKDIDGICRILCPMADKIILTAAHNPRAASPVFIEGRIRKVISRNVCPIIKTRDAAEAISIARSVAAENDLILATGSLFMIGEIRDGFAGFSSAKN